jgi:hypothetical protein
LQRPERRAVERDESEIARWIAHEWPRIKQAGAALEPALKELGRWAEVYLPEARPQTDASAG